MAYTVLEHTADVRLLVEGRTLSELFSEALRGMMDILKAESKEGGEKSTRRIQIESPSRTALLVDFLNEALCLAHTYRESFPAVAFLLISETGLEAVLRGSPANSFGEDIKAVTHHEADIRTNARGNLETTLVFDI